MAEQKNGLEGYFVTKGSKKLRYGYTTGSCAAAAAKAATCMLLSQKKIEKIDLLTPRGILLHLMPLDVCFDEQQASCAIRKDGGDDPDATDGLLVYAVVSKCGKTKEEQIFIDGGKGVGRITKPGLEQPVGAAAINRVPREMITEAVREVCEMCEYTEANTWHRFFASSPSPVGCWQSEPFHSSARQFRLCQAPTSHLRSQVLD